jgi:hypothetical protein
VTRFIFSVILVTVTFGSLYLLVLKSLLYIPLLKHFF